MPAKDRQNQPSPALKLSQMIHGPIVAQLIYVVAKLGVADLLQEGPRDSSELAKAVNVQPVELYRVLRALASFGIFVEVEDGRFGLTPMAEYLGSETEGSLRAWAILWGEGFWWRPYGELLQSVRTGKVAFDHVYDMSFFEYLRQDSEAARISHEAMSNQTTQDTSAIVRAYDFSGTNKVVDVGGGPGSLLEAILKANPDAGGVLFDLPSVIESAREGFVGGELEGRCDLMGGDFLRSAPSGSDIYILKSVLHDWGDGQAVTIL